MWKPQSAALSGRARPAAGKYDPASVRRADNRHLWSRDAKSPRTDEDGWLVRAVLLALLFAKPALIPIMGAFPVRDPDVWWHLATGRWINDNGAVPFQDPFVGGDAAVSWVAYSWPYEIFIHHLHAWLGFDGFFVYSTLAGLAVAAAIYLLVRHMESRFLVALSMATVAIAATWQHQGARTFLASITLFAVELDILMTARRTGDGRRLLALPVLFLIWANVHIQFIYGLLVLGIASAEALYDRFVSRGRVGPVGASFPVGWIVGATAAAAAVTLLTPYTWRLYALLPELAGQPDMWRYVTELQAPGFRSLSEIAFLVLALAAGFALGWRRELRPFPLLLFVLGAALSFRAIRDTWVLTIIAAAILAETISSDRGLVRTRSHLRSLAVGTAVVIFSLSFGYVMRAARQPGLYEVAANDFPFRASHFIEASTRRGGAQAFAGSPIRLFNDMDWGGYLLWRLPQAEVSIDGRIINFGENALARSVSAWAGAPGWDENPELLAADFVVGNVNRPLVALLRDDDRFALAYEDEISAVFVPTEVRLARVD